MKRFGQRSDSKRTHSGQEVGDRGRPRKTVAQEVSELRAMAVPELVERYESVCGKAPRVKHREWLWRRIAWKIQEQRLGGLSSVAKKRLDELIAELDLPLNGKRKVRGKVKGRGTDSDPVVGTVLVRKWREKEIHVTRTDEGWEHDGVVHRSLSAVAKAITGSHVSGPAWFGLVSRKRTAK